MKAREMLETIRKIDHLLDREEHDSGYAAFVHMRKIWPDLKRLAAQADAPGVEPVAWIVKWKDADEPERRVFDRAHRKDDWIERLNGDDLVSDLIVTPLYAAQPQADVTEALKRQGVLDRDKLAHVIAKQIACEEDCQRWPNGCGCSVNAAEAVLAALAAQADAPARCSAESARPSYAEGEAPWSEDEQFEERAKACKSRTNHFGRCEGDGDYEGQCDGCSDEALEVLHERYEPFYGAQCPSYPNCKGGCGLGCTKEHIPADLRDQYNACWDQPKSDALKSAALKALNYIENTENELGIKLSCGDALREVLK
jgi:hypothetical protein